VEGIKIQNQDFGKVNQNLAKILGDFLLWPACLVLNYVLRAYIARRAIGPARLIGETQPLGLGPYLIKAQ
jgi:hypothetical protein